MALTVVGSGHTPVIHLSACVIDSCRLTCIKNHLISADVDSVNLLLVQSLPWAELCRDLEKET